MDTIVLDARPRETGKTATKAVRKSGLVPCVLYGSHTAPVHFSVETLALRPLIFGTETYRVEVAVNGEDYEGILKEIIYHPVTERPMHVDFLALTRGEALTMTIPVLLEGTSPGVKAGGVLTNPIHQIEIRAMPSDIPGSFHIDISELNLGDSLTVGDVQVGGSIEVLTDPELTIASVSAPAAAEEEVDEEDAEIAAEGAAEGDGDASEDAAEAEKDA